MIPGTDVIARLERFGLLAGSAPVVEIGIAGITDDSRQVRAGDLYCAIRGYTEDGHRFLSDAAAAGAVAALVEVPRAEVDLPQIRVTSARRAAAVAAQVVFGDPSRDLRLVGVTGTNGKTTTVQLARHILSRRYRTGSVGTIGVIDPNDERESTGLTTPGPVEFARRLAELKQRGAEVVVVEVSSHALTQDRVSGAAFDVGVFTNLSRDHLDYHSDLEEYRDVKLRLAEQVSADGVLVVNADEPAWSSLSGKSRLIRYGLNEEADYSAGEIHLGPMGSRWTLVGPEGSARVRLPLLGEFNLTNALAAAATAGALGFSVAELADALASASPIPGRVEVLAEEPLVLRDYAHTPDALRRLLSAVRPLAAGRLITVFGAGGDRDPGKRPLMGRAAAEGADYLIITSDNPRSEPPLAIIAQIIEGVGKTPFESISDRRAAIGRALNIARPKDLVVLAGKGHETYQVVGDERRPFDEALIVAEILAEGRGTA